MAKLNRIFKTKERNFSIYPPKIGEIYEDIYFSQLITISDGLSHRAGAPLDL